MGKIGKIFKAITGAAIVGGAAYVAVKNKDKLEEIKDTAVDKIDEIKDTAVEKINEIKTEVVGVDEIEDENERPDEIYEDTTGDGELDTAYVDSDGDGVVDKIVDLNGESEQAPTMEVDEDNDGNPEVVAIDTTGDGQYDTVLEDTTGDGKLDTAFVDTTGDGVVDTVKDIEE